MAWKYRKRIKIAPGVTINVSRNGVSTTIGPKGASVNIGKNGTYLNTGIPGTGIYDRQKIGGGTSRRSSVMSTQNISGGGSTSGYDNSGCFWFIGIAVVTMIVIYAVTGKFDLPMYLLGLFITFVLWLIVVAILPQKGNNSTSAVDSEGNTSSEGNTTETPVATNEPAQRKSNMLFLSWKKENFDLMQSETKSLYEFLKMATRSIKVRKELDRMMALTNNDGSPWPLNNKITLTMMLDAYRCYTDLGYKMNAGDDEELGLLLLANNVASPGFTLDYFQLINYRDNVAPTTREMFDTVKMVHDNCPIPSGQYFFQHVFENVDKERMSQYMVHLYRYASAIAKADDTIDARESEILANLMKAKDLTTDGKPLETKVESRKTRRNTKDTSGFDPYIKDAARFIVEAQVGSVSMIQREFSIGYNRAGMIMDQLEQLCVVGEALGSKPREVLVASTEELEEIFGEKADMQPNTEDSTTEDEIIMDSQNELQSLIGLSSVKAEVERLTNFIKIMKVREKQGLPVSEISYHCVFTGNPGTGKTTVARILANIYNELGVIKKGHLVETDRSGLVAEYVGQTAVKTNKIIDSALDGVLFIDEAYSLVNGGNNDYGTEAISTLLKRMEDDRKRLVVILAGYGNEMQTFIDSNPGLQSRFNRYIDFPDYNTEELLEIYKRNLKKHKYTLSAEAEAFISTYLANAVTNKDKNFGNARFVRNLFERTLENQAMRLASIGHLTSEMLCEISIEDVKSLEN